MKIALLTYGSQGDVEPFIALAEGLLQAGHQVKLAAPEIFSNILDNNKIEFVSLPGNPRMMVDNLVDRAGKNPLLMVKTMSEYVYPLAADVFQKARNSCKHADLIIHSFLMTSTGFEVAREIGAADLSVQTFPVFTTTGKFPTPAFPDLPYGPAYNRFTHQLISWIFWTGSQWIYKRVQKQNPSLPDLTGWPFSPKNPNRTPILYALSPRVVPHPSDWPDDVCITGYWIRKTDPHWQPDPELLKFLESGPPPIAVVFGSTSSSMMKEIQEKIAQTLASLDQRGLFVGADPGLVKTMPDMLYTGYVPYQWLFGRSSAVIHHGGAGTTARAFISGVPQIILPFTSDQPFWAQRVKQLGVGPGPLPPKRFQHQQLARAVNSVIQDQKIRAKAAVLGREISKENGINRALECIENYGKYRA
jgi:sterol 3beta-glucosyltransferase